MMGGWKRVVAALMLAAVVACGQGSASSTSAPGDVTISGPDNRPRLALVIGIGEYRGDIPSLPNPVRDADLMARSLQSVGFTLPAPILRNATREQFQDALTQFARALDAAGPEAIGLIYFAGHGMQINGINYLLPSDARRPSNLPGDAALLRRELSAAFMPADELLLVLGSRPNGASILILDACRDNPLTRSIGQASRSGAVDARQGLYDMSRATGILIAYATTPNDVSLDGGANGNSPYAEALASEMLRGGTVYEVFNRVRGRVEDSTGGRQSPKETNGLRGSDRFCFGPCPSAGGEVAVERTPAVVDVAAVSSCAQAEADWASVSGQTSMTVVRTYAESIPSECGALRGLVQEKINTLTTAADTAYRGAIATRTSAQYQAYLTQFPGSANEADVRARLASCRTQSVQQSYVDPVPMTQATAMGNTQAARDRCYEVMERRCVDRMSGLGLGDTSYEFRPARDANDSDRMHCAAACNVPRERTAQRETCS